MRGVALTVTGFLTTAVVASAGTPVDAASTQKPPTLRIAGYGVSQSGLPQTSSGQSGSKGHCVSYIADGGAPGRGPFLVEPGAHSARIRLHTDDRPTKVKVYEYVGHSPNATKADTRLVERKDAHGRASWVVRFPVTVSSGGDLYLTLVVIDRMQKACSTTTDSYGYRLRGATG